jgi:hypothetical protein
VLPMFPVYSVTHVPSLYRLTGTEAAAVQGDIIHMIAIEPPSSKLGR